MSAIAACISAPSRAPASLPPALRPQGLADLGDDAPRMEHLWDWVSPLTAGMNVACLAWCKANPDLLAVGYGSYAFASPPPPPPAAATTASGQRPGTASTTNGDVAGGDDAAAAAKAAATARPQGLVAFWSLKNLSQPLWSFEAKAAVTALDFSTYRWAARLLGWRMCAR